MSRPYADLIQRGNTDLIGSGVWTGTPEPKPTPLPGHEHDDVERPGWTESRVLDFGLGVIAGLAANGMVWHVAGLLAGAGVVL